MLRNPAPTALGTYNLIVTNEGVKNLSPLLEAIAVQSSYASDVWLQVFSGISIPANGTVPIMSPIAVAANSRNVGLTLVPMGIKIPAPGIVLVASSTPNTLTAVAAATLDITAYIDEYEYPVLPTDTIVGDLTTGVRNLTVWNNAAGPNVLRRAVIINTANAVRYAVIYATDSPDVNSKIIAWQKLGALSAIEMNFGTTGGLSPIQILAGGDAANVNRVDGCTIYGQQDLVPGNLMPATDFTIKAYYASM